MDNYNHNFMLEDIFYETGVRDRDKHHLRSVWLLWFVLLRLKVC